MVVANKISPKPIPSKPPRSALEMLVEQVEHNHRSGHLRKKKQEPKNPAPSLLFDALARWANDLGMTWVEVLGEAFKGQVNKGRGGAKQIRDGAAGWPTASKVEQVVGDRARTDGRFVTRLSEIHAWCDLGYEIAIDRPDLLVELTNAVDAAYDKLMKERPAPPGAKSAPAPITGIARARKDRRSRRVP